MVIHGPPPGRYIQRLGKCPGEENIYCSARASAACPIANAADAFECALLTLNISGLCISVAAIALYAAADAAGALLSAPPLFITLFIAFSCAIGIPASCKRSKSGPSCWLLLCVFFKFRTR